MIAVSNRWVIWTDEAIGLVVVGPDPETNEESMKIFDIEAALKEEDLPLFDDPLLAAEVTAESVLGVLERELGAPLDEASRDEDGNLIVEILEP